MCYYILDILASHRNFSQLDGISHKFLNNILEQLSRRKFLIHNLCVFSPLLYRLNVAFLPMLLHLHQCQLDFLVDFFGRKNSSNDQFPNNCHELEGSKSSPERSKDHACHSIVQEALLPYFQASCVI